MLQIYLQLSTFITAAGTTRIVVYGCHHL